MTYNMMTCIGFSGMGCTIAWFGFIILVFLTLIMRRQCDDGIFAGTNFNFLFAWLGIVIYVIVMTFTGDIRWGLPAGIIGLTFGGIGIGQIWEFSGGSSDEY